MSDHKKNLGILLEFGFHEVKKYIHSGFSEKLSADFNLYYFALNKNNQQFHDSFNSIGSQIIYIEEQSFSNKIHKIEVYNQSIRRSWLSNKKLGGFQNHRQIGKKKLRSQLIGNKVFKTISTNLTIYYTKKYKPSPNLKQQILDNKIDLLFTTGVSSNFSKSFISTGLNLNLPVHYLVNSWKDLFINNFIPFNNLTSIFLWSNRMKEDYKYQMKYLKSNSLIVSGNPTFDILIDYQPRFDRKYYSEKYNLPMNSNWLLYTMMPIGINDEEIETIVQIGEGLQKDQFDDEFTLIIRKNPNHSASDFNNISLPKNTVVANHYCSFDKEKDLILQTGEGEIEWLDLLFHCSANLSIPSTVTLEFLILNKPVFNIAFDKSNKIDKRIEQFFEAGFYKPMFSNPLVKKINSLQELNTALKQINNLNFSVNKQEMAAYKIIDTLKKSMK